MSEGKSNSLKIAQREFPRAYWIFAKAPTRQRTSWHLALNASEAARWVWLRLAIFSATAGYAMTPSS